MTTTTTHAHHWRIDPPNGPESIGSCDCGAIRQFRNVHPADMPPNAWSKGRPSPMAGPQR